MHHLAQALRALNLAERCTRIADRVGRDPYNTANGHYWLAHAEKLDAACNRLLDQKEKLAEDELPAEQDSDGYREGDIGAEG